MLFGKKKNKKKEIKSFYFLLFSQVENRKYMYIK